jgi:hypothetical protein
MRSWSQEGEADTRRPLGVDQHLHHAQVPSAGPEVVGSADAIVVAAIEAAVPALVSAHHLVERFQAMMPSRNGAALDPWIAEWPKAGAGEGIRTLDPNLGSCPSTWCRSGTPRRVSSPYQAASIGSLMV